MCLYMQIYLLISKVFVSLSWMAKATVQAALGPIALKHLSADDPDVPYAQIVLMVCILSIVVTAPTGAILISITGTKLLTKTKSTHMPEGLNTKFMKMRFFAKKRIFSII